MGCVHGRTSRVVHFLVAALAVLGFELDVMSNPFSPDLILSQISALLHPSESGPIGTGDDLVEIRGNSATGAKRSGDSETRPARSLGVKPTVDEAVAAAIRN